MAKAFLSGNEALAQGVWEGGLHFATGYPGTPSTEILETIAARFPEVECQWAVNEKVAVEVAGGASFGGARAMATMKHVGLNVAADPFFSLSFAGAWGGLLIVSADDPGMHSSQNEQDNRYYARAARCPMVEPSSSQEARDFAIQALEISEKFEAPILFRMTTRICHSKGIVETGPRKEVPRKGYQSKPDARVLMPSNARKRHEWVLERARKLEEFGNTCSLNRWEKGSSRVGVITSGVAYNYVKEVLPGASVLKLGLTWPLPWGLIEEFAASVEKLYVVEEGDPLLEKDLKARGIACTGKEVIPITGELTPEIVRRGIAPDTAPARVPEPVPAPSRPPVLCPGCPHRPIFYWLRRMRKSTSGDIGCYTLGAIPPLSAMDTCICMGASISGLEGLEKGAGREATTTLAAAIGDSTFIHSGITGLVDMVYNRATGTVLILDNEITAMTGRQEHPATGRDIRGNPAPMVDIPALCRAVGVERVQVVDPYDMQAVRAVLKEEMAREELSVVVFRRPCVLKERSRKKSYAVVDPEKCTDCGACLRLGCPAIEHKENHAWVNPLFCYPECSMCVQVCPTGAISKKTDD